MIQLSSEITEPYDVISKELKIKESCPIGRTGRKETIGNLIENGEMNITQRKLYDDYIKARYLGERRERNR